MFQKLDNHDIYILDKYLHMCTCMYMCVLNILVESLDPRPVPSSPGGSGKQPMNASPEGIH